MERGLFVQSPFSFFFVAMTLGAKIEYCLFLLVAALLPISWRYAVWGEVLLSLFVFVRCFVNKGKLKKPSLPATALMALFACYAVSLLYTDNLQIGANTLVYKLSFLVLPLVFVFAEMNWFEKDRKRVVMYVFTYSLAAFVLVRWGIAVYNFFFESNSIYHFFAASFIPVHRGYLAMYVLLALSFIYSERSVAKANWMKVANAVSAFLVISVILFTQSRAGMLMLALLVLAIWIEVTFLRKRFVVGTTFALAALLFAGGLFAFLPDKYNRITSTIQDAREGNVMGARAWTNKAAWQVIQDNPVWGVGIGDRVEQMGLRYENMGKLKIRDRQLNPHNQFLDNQMTVGVVGTLLYLFVLLIPICFSKYRNWMSVSLVLIVAVSSLLESILERQMGIVFFSFFMLLFTYGCNVDRSLHEV